MGVVYSVLGMFIAVGLCCAGSTIGITQVNLAAAGVCTEDPEKFGKTMMLQLLPSTQGIYGFIVALILLMAKVVGVDDLSTSAGLTYLILCIPIGIMGLLTAILQGRVASHCVIMVSKHPEMSGRAMVMTSFTEMFVLLAFIMSIIGIIML